MFSGEKRASVSAWSFGEKAQEAQSSISLSLSLSLLYFLSLFSLSTLDLDHRNEKNKQQNTDSHSLLVGKEVDAGDEAILALQARAALCVAQGARLLGLLLFREKERKEK